LGLSALFTKLARYCGVFKLREAKENSIIIIVGALQATAITLGQASLKHNSLDFFQLVKQMQVPLVAIIEFIAFGRRLSSLEVLLLFIMTIGACFACASDVQFSWFGATIAIAGVVSTSCEVVLYAWLQKSHGWETLQLLHRTMPRATVLMMSAALYFDFGTTNLKEEDSRVTGIDMRGIILFATSCVLGMAVNVSSCSVGGKASALAYAMFGLAKTLSVILAGFIFFDGVLTLRLLSGTLMAFGAIIAYSCLALSK